ncbi:hypothetical protein MMC26_002263 [Xylographa opegraphella]|nr:hypothetical protein [Xylographa opegraphella]
MSGRTTPDGESRFEVGDNDSQSECSIDSESVPPITDRVEITNDSSTALASYRSESDRCPSVDIEGDLDSFLLSRRAGPEVALLQTGTWAVQNPGTDLPRQEGVIPQELLLDEEPTDTHTRRRLREEEEPWSLFNPAIISYNSIAITWIIRMYQPRVIRHTKMAIQQFLQFDEAGCYGDVEGIWIAQRDAHRHIRLACDTFLAMVVALAVLALLTLGSYGIELSFMIIYGLGLLAFAVLAVIRMLFA